MPGRVFRAIISVEIHNERRLFQLNIYTLGTAMEEARTYMRIAGYPALTKRDAKACVRVAKGFLRADRYVQDVVTRYRNVHGSGYGEPRVPRNLLNTRDGAILRTAERKIYPVRLVEEFRSGPPVGFAVGDLAGLNRRVCGDLYPDAGSFRSDADAERLGAVLSECARNVRSTVDGSAGVSGVCREFETLLAAMLTVDAFSRCGLFTAMAFIAKSAFACGYECRFSGTRMPGTLVFEFSDRRAAASGRVLIA